MVDVNALNTVFWGSIIISAVAVALAAAWIVFAALADRRRHARHVESGVRALEAHLAHDAKARLPR